MISSVENSYVFIFIVIQAQVQDTKKDDQSATETHTEKISDSDRGEFWAR